MTTIHSSRMAALIANHQSLDLIDVRTEQEFQSFHIPGAQSFPLKNISAPNLLRRRKLAATEPLYIISSNRVQAGLAAGILKGAGCLHPTVVEGGMNIWMSRGLSVVRKRSFWKFARELLFCGLTGVIRGFSLVISGLFGAFSSMVVFLQRSLATKSEFVIPIPSKPR